MADGRFSDAMIPYGVATHGAVPLNSIQAVLHTIEIGSDQTVLGSTKHVPAIQKLQSTAEPPELCSTWISANNSSPGYGDIIAYPAIRLQAKCHESTSQQQRSAYTCSEDPVNHLPVISNYWSTSAMDDATNQPLARVLVDVLALDITNQTVTIGKPQMQPAR